MRAGVKLLIFRLFTARHPVDSHFTEFEKRQLLISLLFLLSFPFLVSVQLQVVSVLRSVRQTHNIIAMQDTQAFRSNEEFNPWNNPGNIFVRDEKGNVWYRECSYDSRTATGSFRISIIKRQDALSGPVVITHSSKMASFTPGQFVKIDSLSKSNSIDFFLLPEDDITRKALLADTEKVEMVSDENHIFHVSKALLLCLSDVFRRMFSRNCTEATTGVISMSDVPSSVLSGFVHFLENNSFKRDSDLDHIIELGFIADRYNVCALKRMVELEICARFDQTGEWDRVYQLCYLLQSDWIALALAHRTGSNGCKRVKQGD